MLLLGILIGLALDWILGTIPRIIIFVVILLLLVGAVSLWGIVTNLIGQVPSFYGL